MGNLVSLPKSRDGNYMHMGEKNLEALQTALKELKEKREDVLRRVVTEEDGGLQRLSKVHAWLAQVNDLLEARSTQTKRFGLLGYGRKISKNLEKIKRLISNGVFDVVAGKIHASKVEKKHIQTTVGMDKKVKKAWNSLMEDGPRTLGLHGIGGIGKTTLLAHINNKFLEPSDKFDVVLWVLVSRDFHYKGIQDQILRRLDLDKKWGQETEEERAYEIHKILSGKKFVLLLDDLWSKVDLNKVGVPPVTQQNGSKIVFTTRYKKVCKDMEADAVMEVVRLSIDESWELFQKQLDAFTIRFHPDMALARRVSVLCYGLPLALKVIGQSMNRKMNARAWNLAIHALPLSGHEFYSRPQENILRLLKVSYDNLEDGNVKSCFLYCLLFPQDYDIEANELIEYWICQGFIEDGDTKKGYEIIELLVRMHLLMQGEVKTKVRMHDVVREMALWVATHFGHDEPILCVKSGVWLHEIPENIHLRVVERISLMRNEIKELSCSFLCPKLSTLLLQNNKLVDISGEFFRFMPALVVLNLSNNEGLIGLPEEISNLGSLQYLNLSETGIKSLPVGVKKLRRLINLNLSFTRKLQSSGGITTSFPNLQVLRLFDSGACVDDVLMKELQLLEHLKILTATFDDAVMLESIQGIVRLSSIIQSLCLRNMSAVVVTLNTVALSGLEILSIMNCKVSEIKIDWKNTESDGISPCANPRGFKKLYGVRIRNLEGPRDLTWLLFAQHLMYLVGEESSSIEEIINGEKEMGIENEYPHIVAPFKRFNHLKASEVNEIKRTLHLEVATPFEKVDHLKVSGMNELKTICSKPKDLLPNLREFIVQRCPKMPLSLRNNRRNGWKALE
ncbi:unnamed protein product [Microthlaspi erraticum]|uniref:Uncharacterized protein n=1 Tax=Microthlaspi erraticum TaxID=1685480 RepID=A0A6D2J8R0_9BRAS|nr:unnamed protein product [Microthlaspi erraticum]